MPAAIVQRLYREIAESTKNPDLRKRLGNEGMQPLGTTPQELDEYIVREIEKYAKVAKAAGLSVN